MNPNEKIFTRADQKETRQRLRREAPRAEQILWQHIRGQKLGAKFRRQHSIGKYVVDFYCPELKLAIEIDGPTHDDENAKAADFERQNFLENYGVCFLRFTNRQIYGMTEAVCNTVAAQIDLLRKNAVTRLF